MTPDERNDRVNAAGIRAMQAEAERIKREDYKARRCQGSYSPRPAIIRYECKPCLRYLPAYSPQAEYIAAALHNGECTNRVTDAQDTQGLGF